MQARAVWQHGLKEDTAFSLLPAFLVVGRRGIDAIGSRYYDGKVSLQWTVNWFATVTLGRKYHWNPLLWCVFLSFVYDRAHLKEQHLLGSSSTIYLLKCQKLARNRIRIWRRTWTKTGDPARDQLLLVFFSTLNFTTILDKWEKHLIENNIKLTSSVRLAWNFRR